MNIFAVSLASLIPAVLLCWYIYAKDRLEKEPLGLLALLFGAGAIAYIPAVFVENFVISLFDKAFVSQINYSLTGVATYVSQGAEVGHSLCRGFLSVALLEELAKWMVLFFITRRNKEFNSLFDGIVYAVFVSLGFATAESIRYGIFDGWDTFLLRTVTNLPAQMTFGVIMGFFYTVWHTYHLAKKREKYLIENQNLYCEKPFKSAPFLVLSVAIPFVLHGIYSFMKYIESDTMMILFYIFVLILYVLCFVVVHKMSAADNSDEKTVNKLILKKYPGIVIFAEEE